jgi:quercetin dioxygenase-like cupin family protein
MNGKNSRAFASCFAAAAVVAMAMSGVAKDSPDFVRITPSQLVWRDVPDGHGVQQATVFGDPSKPGIYMIRVKFPPHVMDIPHLHPNARYVTVLQGTWYSGTGDTFDFAKAIPLKAGSVMLHPAKATHWDGSGGPETVIVQIFGEGPESTTPVESGKAFWLEVPH